MYAGHMGPTPKPPQGWHQIAIFLALQTIGGIWWASYITVSVQDLRAQATDLRAAVAVITPASTLAAELRLRDGAIVDLKDRVRVLEQKTNH